MIRPTRTIIVFDGKGGSNRRRKIFPQYKWEKDVVSFESFTTS